MEILLLRQNKWPCSEKGQVWHSPQFVLHLNREQLLLPSYEHLSNHTFFQAVVGEFNTSFPFDKRREKGRERVMLFNPALLAALVFFFFALLLRFPLFFCLSPFIARALSPSLCRSLNEVILGGN